MSSRRSVRIDMVFTLLAPLHHGAGTEGNVSLLRTQRVVVPGTNKSIDLPVLSGNAIKHRVFRQPGVDHMLEALGIGDGELSRPVVHLLYSGGALNLKGSSIDVQVYRELCELVPMLGVLGGALGNFMMASRLSVGHAIPFCAEYEPYIAPDCQDADGMPARFGLLLEAADAPPVAALLDTQMGTRHDPLRQPNIRRLVEGEGIRALEAKQADMLETRRKGEHAKDEDTQQMIYERQVLAMGAQLCCTVHTEQCSQLEEAAVWAALHQWYKRPYLGANSSVGNGMCRLRLTASEPIKFEDPVWKKVPTPLMSDGQFEAVKANALIEAYEQHLRDRRNEITEGLREVVR